MRTELESVLADALFVRSPVLARLLTYLVETTLDGNGKGLKSYAVAVDGLGRNPDFDSQADASARVQVGRLRRLLDNFYNSTGSHHSRRLLIVSGSYEVRLVGHDRSDASHLPVSPIKRVLKDRRARTAAIAALAVILLLSAIAIVHFRTAAQATTQRWRASNFPSVDVTMRDGGSSASIEKAENIVRQTMIQNIYKYEGIETSFGGRLKADYTINLSVSNTETGFLTKIFVIENKSDSVVWFGEANIPIDQSASDIKSDKFISSSAFMIAHPTGVIHSNERKRSYELDTPYGCWLTFTAQLQNKHSVDDGLLGKCAKDWYSAAPHHPLAAALYGWTLIDKSIHQTTQANRKATIRKALDVLENAKALSPNSAFLHVALMRAYGFSGEVEAMRNAAHDAIQLNPDNLDTQGLAGLMLALRNDPQGETLINRSLKGHFNPPPWYFIGLYVSAMMREDTAGTEQALVKLEKLNHSLPILPIFSAAYEAHTGHLVQARASWERAKSRSAILRVNPKLFFDRMPLAPEVSARLQEWLEPVLAD